MRQALTSGVMERLGLKAAAHAKGIEQIDSEMVPTSIAADYERLIGECLQLLGLSTDLVRVSVRPVGMNPAGLEVYAAFIMVQRWEQKVIQLLARMPYVEKKIERCIKHGDMLRYSAFAGLWFRTPAKLEAVGTMH